MCLTEHHLKDYEIDNLPIDHLKLGSEFYRRQFNNGGVCIFIHEELEFFSISLDKKDTEICAVRLNITHIRGLSGKYSAILNISRSGRVALM